MCGIVGYTGHVQAAPILLDGLARLEYRGYDSAGLAVRNGAEPAEDPKDESRPTLRKGSKGAAVKELQQILMDKGYDLGKWGADGDFGSQTEKAVKQFQKEHDDRDGYALKVDGIVGEMTWGALDDAVGKNGD